MQFEKQLMYLGSRELVFKDGKIMHALSFFDADGQNTVDINVMDDNAVMPQVRSLTFATPCLAVIRLNPAKQEKNAYKLSLVGLSPVKG